MTKSIVKKRVEPGMVAHGSNLVLGSGGRGIRSSRSLLHVGKASAPLAHPVSPFPPRLLPSSKCSPVKEASGAKTLDLSLRFSLIVFLRLKSPLDVCPSVIDIPSHNETRLKEREESQKKRYLFTALSPKSNGSGLRVCVSLWWVLAM